MATEGMVEKMKKATFLAWMYIFLISVGTMISLHMPTTKTIAEDVQVIPAEAIRLRILANSNGKEDQELKRKIRDAVNEQITLWVQDLTSIEEARAVLQANLPLLEEIAKDVMKKEGNIQPVSVNFGKVSFPTKLYGQFLYPAGEYEAILITLGEGKGANWWCVLYPPLCFLDFSNSVATSPGFEEEEQTNETVEIASEPTTDSKEQKPVYAGDETQEVEVKFFVWELFKDLFAL
jgi:stage II sporulation protein R